MIALFVSGGLAWSWIWGCGHALQEGQRPQDTISQLLDAAAPAASYKPYLLPIETNQAPADSAPVEVLLQYWASDSVRYKGLTNPGKVPKPTDAVRARLLEGCEKEPRFLPSVLGMLADTPETHERVKAILDREEKAPAPAFRSKDEVRTWLMQRSRFLRDDLVKAAAEACFKDGKYIEGEESLRALAKLDWHKAETVLEKHAAGGEPRLAALALALQLEHATRTSAAKAAEELRNRLKSIVTDRKAPGFARDFAVRGLLAVAWEGRDDWYVSQFEDDSLRELNDGIYLLTPLSTPVAENPDRWIPVVSKLVGHRKREIHDAAVSCLIPFHLDRARKDALKPLLPWLSDPEWSSARDRLRLIQSLDRVDLPESVPGLIWVVENSVDFELAGAAEALRVYKDKRAVPALKGALQRPDREFQKRSVVAALMSCEGLSDNEIAGAIEAYAGQISTEKGRKELQETSDIIPKVQLSPEVSLGYHLSYLNPTSEGAVKLLFKRADELGKSNPEVARILRGIVVHWPLPAVDRQILEKVGVGSADAEAIQALLARREKVRQDLRPELEKLATMAGWPRGVATTVLGDREKTSAVVRDSDSEATRALLATARLVREALPVDQVGTLLSSENKMLALAAERYLETEDSAAARKLIQAKHADEFRILGARMKFDPGHNTYLAFDGWESRLRDEIRSKDGPGGIFALLSGGYWGSAGQVIVRFRGDKAEVSALGREGGDPKSRALSAEELKAMLDFISNNHVDDLPPLTIQVADGMQYEYLHLTKTGGRRVFMNNPGVSSSAGSVYDRLVTEFKKLAN